MYFLDYFVFSNGPSKEYFVLVLFCAFHYVIRQDLERDKNTLLLALQNTKRRASVWFANATASNINGALCTLSTRCYLSCPIFPVIVSFQTFLSGKPVKILHFSGHGDYHYLLCEGYNERTFGKV